MIAANTDKSETIYKLPEEGETTEKQSRRRDFKTKSCQPRPTAVA